MRLVQFWLLVNNIKDPLEDADSDPLPQHSTWTQNDIDDLSAILHGYFSDPTIDVDLQLKDELANFLNDPSKATPEQYQAARKAILITQQSVYQSMEREDWLLFRRTDFWHKYLSADSAPPTPAKPALPPAPKLSAQSMTRSNSTGMIPSRQTNISSSRNESATDLRKVLRNSRASRIPSEETQASSEESASRGEDMQPVVPQQSEEDVVNAISAALNDIIRSDVKDDVDSIRSRDSVDSGERPFPASARSSVDIPRPLFESSAEHEKTVDRTDSLTSEATATEPARERAPIFTDDDNRPDFAIEMLRRTSTDESRATSGYRGLDIFEELEMVDTDIERLKKEIRLTNRMIGKAELTGSYDELRLLKDSRASMDRELARKEELRDTYATHGGEHSLMVHLLSQ